MGEGDGTLNLRGVSTVLALAGSLKSEFGYPGVYLGLYPRKESSFWAKDLVFVVSDGYLDGMQAWTSTYHGAEQSSVCVSARIKVADTHTGCRHARRSLELVIGGDLDRNQYRLPRALIFSPGALFR